MTVGAVGIETSPTMNALITTAVPEPAEHALMLVGLGLIAWRLRMRRAV